MIFNYLRTFQIGCMKNSSKMQLYGGSKLMLPCMKKQERNIEIKCMKLWLCLIYVTLPNMFSNFIELFMVYESSFWARKVEKKGEKALVESICTSCKWFTKVFSTFFIKTGKIIEVHGADRIWSHFDTNIFGRYAKWKWHFYPKIMHIFHMLRDKATPSWCVG